MMETVGGDGPPLEQLLPFIVIHQLAVQRRTCPDSVKEKCAPRRTVLRAKLPPLKPHPSDSLDR
jgi:hypothetical protein